MPWSQKIVVPERVSIDLNLVLATIDPASLRATLFGRQGNDEVQILLTYFHTAGVNVNWASAIVAPERVAETLNGQAGTVDAGSLRVIPYARIRNPRSFVPQMLLIYSYA